MLAKWLKGVTVAVAHACPDDQHAMFLSSNQCLCVHVCMYRCSLDPFYIENSGDQLRIRASVFINLVAMRSCISRSRNTSCILEPSNVSVLNRSNFSGSLCAELLLGALEC